MAQKDYPDIQVTRGDAKTTWDLRGFRAYRKFKVTAADMTDPTMTLYSIITAHSNDPVSPLSDIPSRMTPHPTIQIPSDWSNYYLNNGTFAADNCFCADVITIDAISSTQAEVTVEYAVLNAMTQEPSDAGGNGGDLAPALLQMGSSVQTSKVAQDAFGQPIVVPYIADGAVDYQIYPAGTGFDATTDPSIKITADVQFPLQSFRFQRRETQPRPNSTDAIDYPGFINSTAWIIAGKSYPQHTILCTRMESTTEDNGLSWIVTYEFLYKDYIEVPVGTSFVSPSVNQGTTMSPLASPWDLIAYYAIPSGIGQDSGGNTIAQNMMPDDAVPSVFALYDDVDFNGFLMLTA